MPVSNDFELEGNAEWRDAGFTHFSPSQLNQDMSKWLYKYAVCTTEQRQKARPNLRMEAGSAVNRAVDSIYIGRGAETRDKSLKPAPVGEACTNAIEDLRRADVWYPEDYSEQTIEEMLEAFCDAIPQTIENAVTGIEQLGSAVETVEDYIYWHPHFTVLPVEGFTDFKLRNGIRIELKTKWPRLGREKIDGTRSWTVTSNPLTATEGWLRQGLVYQRATESPTYILSVNAKNFRLYSIDEDDETLAVEADIKRRLRARCDAIHQIVKAPSREEGVRGIMRQHPPDFNHYLWNDDPDVVQHAKQMWESATDGNEN